MKSGGHTIQPLLGLIEYDEAASDLAFQQVILQGVSRTFALTIPQLPEPLCTVVGNAYLLCRLADTIEDAAELDGETKQRYAAHFIEVVGGRSEALAFASELEAALDERTPAAERELVLNTERVVRLTHAFNWHQRGVLERCVTIMSRGMSAYQEAPSLAGLENQAELDRYCYFVAGVVGEMLTELFCEHCEIPDSERHQLLELSVSFGQGLQMTNILKDIWEDRRRGACWLPDDVFRKHGVSLALMSEYGGEPGFAAALDELIGIATQHLTNALEFTLRLPASQVGIRRFCLWALGMAVMTLRKLHAHPAFARGAQVKISRNTVRATVAATSLAVRRDGALRRLFALASASLPAAPVDYLQADVSCWEHAV
jgi:farnesyl-diphosphate farnesyltransferase